MAAVLVVEKQPNLRLLMEFELEDAEHQGVLLSDGAEALNLLEQERPDVVVLGMGWPPDDDMHTLCCLKNLYPDLPVILFSSSVELLKPEIVRMCEAFVLKHSNLDVLLSEIDRLSGPHIPQTIHS